MTDRITRRQREVLEAIRSWYRIHGAPPSMRELARLLGIKSPSTVHQHIRSLLRKGYLRKAIDKHGIFRNYIAVDETDCTREVQP
jgi:repressor LexA